MFLSIIIPVYNAEKYIDECLQSCLNQNISKDEYEIICVNDGSKDNSPEILRSYAEKYPNIIPINRENGGGERRTEYRSGCGKRRLYLVC